MASTAELMQSGESFASAQPTSEKPPAYEVNKKKTEAEER